MQLDSNQLKHLVPINQLHKDHRQKIAEQSRLLELRVGDELTANEEHRWFLYLLQGKMDLMDVEHQATLIRHEDDRAHHPLFHEAERKTTLVAQTNCVVVQFDKQLFHTFVDQEMLSGEEFHSTEMSEVESLLFNEIMQAFNRGELSLPSQPERARKIKAALHQTGLTLDKLTHIVAADPALTIRLMQIANGPMGREHSALARSIPAAISRLGLETARQLIQGLAEKELFKSQSSLLNDRLQQLYEQSLDVATIAYSLSEQSHQLSPDHVYFAGLISEIGVLPILSCIEKTGLIISGEAELEKIIQRLKAAVGNMVVNQWNLSTQMLEVVELDDNWSRQTEGNVDLCDLLIMAKIYSRLKQHKLQGLPDIKQVPAFRKLFTHKVDNQFAGRIFAQSHIEIASTQRLLNM